VKRVLLSRKQTSSGPDASRLSSCLSQNAPQSLHKVLLQNRPDRLRLPISADHYGKRLAGGEKLRRPLWSNEEKSLEKPMMTSGTGPPHDIFGRSFSKAIRGF